MEELKKKLDDLWFSGLTPRVTIDATHSDVIFPLEVKKKWGTKMAIDLEPSFNTVFDDTSITVDLTFSGTPSKCVIPWKRIYIIQGRDMRNELHDGIVVGGHIPMDFRIFLEQQIAAVEAAAYKEFDGVVDEPHQVSPVMTEQEAIDEDVAPVQVERVYGPLRSIRGGKA